MTAANLGNFTPEVKNVTDRIFDLIAVIEAEGINVRDVLSGVFATAALLTQMSGATPDDPVIVELTTQLGTVKLVASNTAEEAAIEV
jgi:hypothetical protein